MAESSRISFLESGKSLLHLKNTSRFFFNNDKTHCMIASSKLLREHWSHKCCYSSSGNRQDPTPKPSRSRQLRRSGTCSVSQSCALQAEGALLWGSSSFAAILSQLRLWGWILEHPCPSRSIQELPLEDNCWCPLLTLSWPWGTVPSAQPLWLLP